MALFESIFARSRNSVSRISHALISTINTLRCVIRTDATRLMGSTRLDFESRLISSVCSSVSAGSRYVVFDEGCHLERQAAAARIPIHRLSGGCFMP